MLLFTLLLAGLASAANVTSNFVSCVDGLNGLTTITSGSKAYTNVTTTFNLRLDYQPSVVVYPCVRESL